VLPLLLSCSSYASFCSCLRHFKVINDYMQPASMTAVASGIEDLVLLLLSGFQRSASGNGKPSYWVGIPGAMKNV
jgi:hypothetical protein